MANASETPTIDRLQFERSVRPRLPRLRRTALQLTRDRFDADDLMQDTLVRALRFWSSFETGTSLDGWLARILYNTFVTRCRKQRSTRRFLRQLAWREPEPRHGEAQVHAQLFSTLDDRMAARWQRLNAADRSLLRLVHALDLSYEEAAARMRCPVGTVMSRLHRARRSLRGSVARAGQLRLCAGEMAAAG